MLVSGRSSNDEVMKISPGDVVLTTYGVAVVVHVEYQVQNTTETEEEEEEEEKTKTLPCFFRARLWRVPGKSIVSSTTAFLRHDTIIKRLPAAPGMVASYKDDTSKENSVRCLVHSYSAEKDQYVVSPIIAAAINEENDKEEEQTETTTTTKSLITVSSSKVSTSRSAKFYPLIDELLQRGDRAASSASWLFQSTSNFTSISTTIAATKDVADAAIDSSSKFLSKEKVDAVSTTLQEEVIPEARENLKDVYTMLRDEELTVLLKKGRDRLRQLVDTDIPKATEITLRKAGIEILTSETTTTTTTTTDSQNSSSFGNTAQTMAQSREKALAAINNLLSDKANMDLETMQQAVGDHFSSMFDSLSEAARSDATLSSIFEDVSGKTAKWQEQTGRLLSTRSVNLFVEGTRHLQERAAAILGRKQLAWAQESGDRLTKAFSEGDAAVARLKSIELGEALRSRLISAIELRSDSLGGLDGIIASALSSATGNKVKNIAGVVTGEGGDKTDDGDNSLQFMISKLQESASTATQSAHESLIAVLSQQSHYRDVVVLRLEQVFVDLEDQLGEHLDAEQIAAVARGETGTAALFEPIAKKASKEIEKHLNAAELSVADPTILAVLKRVRKIVSGELSFAGLVDEMADVLNNEDVVAAGEDIVKRGEKVLDVLEGSSPNQTMTGVMVAVEKAGITKESVMEHVEKLDMNNLLNTAESAVSDEKARMELLSNATDSALDFLLRILPSMPVPPLDGVRDGLIYRISDLSMEGFKVKKEDITVEIAGIRASKNANEDKININGSAASEPTEGKEMNGDDILTPLHHEIHNGGGGENGIFNENDTNKAIKPTELLIIDVRNISALLDDAAWSFEQTYLPYLKGNGKANVELLDGSIRLQFELRRMKVETSTSSDDEVQWQPVLCLHDRTCEIGQVGLKFQGEGRLTWMVNKLASIFKGPLRDYVVRVVVRALAARSGWLLQKLNDVLSGYWDLVLRTAGISMDELLEVNKDDIVTASPDENKNEINLVWRAHLPLGMNLLLNDVSGHVKVVDFPRGSQARKVATEQGVDPDILKGATIVAVNGSRFAKNDQASILASLKEPGRPKTVNFELASADDAEKVRKFVAGGDGNNDDQLDDMPTIPPDNVARVDENFEIVSLEIVESGDLGIQFLKSPDNHGLVVRSFLRDSTNNELLEVEKSGKVSPGDLLTHINGALVLGQGGSGVDKAIATLESDGSNRPITLSFTKPYLYHFSFEKPSGISIPGGPGEFLFEEKRDKAASNRVVLKGFGKVDGVAESSGIFLGDHLIYIHDKAVGAASRMERGLSPDLSEVLSIISDDNSYPISLAFARPREGAKSRWTLSSQFDISASESLVVIARSFQHLGCEIGTSENDNHDFVVTDLLAVKGFIQTEMEKSFHGKSMAGLAVESINSQFVPSYATGDMVSNALKQSWAGDGKVEILFCDDRRKEWTWRISADSDLP